MAHCTQCGAQLKPNKAFCTACGAKAKKAAAPQAAPPASQAALPASTPPPPLCSNCGAVVPRGKYFCPQCGQSVLAAPLRQPGDSSAISAGPPPVVGVSCSKCGAMVPLDKRFCTQCGNPVEVKPADTFLPSPLPLNPPVIESAAAAPAKLAEVKPPPSKMTPARRRLLYIGLPVAAVVIVAALVAIYAFFLRKPPHLDDRQLLESYYGAPSFFTVILAKDESQPSAKSVRREVWVYPDRKVSFVFLGGKYQFSSDLQSMKGAAKAAKPLRLEQITETLTVDDLSKLVGNKPVSQANLPQELPDAIRYDYGNGINAVFSQGRLLMVRVMPASEEK